MVRAVVDVTLKPLLAAFAGVPAAELQFAALVGTTRLASCASVAASVSVMVVSVAGAEPVLATAIDHCVMAPGMFFGLVTPLNGSHSRVAVLLTVSAAVTTE